MKKRPVGLKILTILGSTIGTLIVLIYSMSPGQYLEQGLGLACILFSIGLLTLWNWVRIVITLLSVVFALLFLAGIAGIIKDVLMNTEGWQWGAMALTVFFSLFLMSLGCVVYLTRPKIKDIFLNKRTKT